MTIYMLETNEYLGSKPTFLTSMTPRRPRSERKVEYFASKEKAQAREHEIRASLKSLLGQIDDEYEIKITPVEVIE